MFGHNSAVGRAVGLAVGLTVGSLVGRSLGEAVGYAVGLAVGIAVGSAVGWLLGEAVGLAVTSAVGLNDATVAAVHTWVVSVSMKSTSPSKSAIRKVCRTGTSHKQVHTPCEGLARWRGGGRGHPVADRVCACGHAGAFSETPRRRLTCCSVGSELHSLSCTWSVVLPIPTVKMDTFCALSMAISGAGSMLP